MADTLTSPTSTDPYLDHDAIRALVARKREEWSKGRLPFLRAAYRNLLFYRGIQWIAWDRGVNRYRPAMVPRGTPTPVTNKFAESIDALVSVFARVEPKLGFAPGSPDEPEDRAAADVAGRAITVVEDEVAIRLNRQSLATWVGLTPMAWLETGYDNDPAHGMRSMDVNVCTMCQQAQAPSEDAMPPMCESCGAPTMPETKEFPVGKMFAAVRSIFDMLFDPAITDWTKQRAYICENAPSVDEAKRRWPAHADSIKTNVSMGTEEWYAEALPTMAPEVDTRQGARMVTNARPASGVRESWYWQLPDETYPDGLLAILLGRETVAFAGPLPYGRKQADGSKQPFLPHVCFPQKLVPGSGYGKTVADDLAVKQAQRNRWESIVEAIAMRVGAPLWLKPLGCNVRNLTGEPGQIVDYTISPTNPNAKPERIPGQGIPMAYMHMITQIDKDMEGLAGTFDVIKGARPEGISAGIALQILQERGMSRFGPLFILWEQAWAEWARQALEIAREYWTEERILKIKGRNGQWEVQKFLGADFAGRIDVIPEAGSSMPRSTLVERAEVEQLIATGVLNPAEPETRYELVKLFNKGYMLPSMEADTKNAIMEQEAFEALAENPVWQTAGPEAVDELRLTDYTAIVRVMRGHGIELPEVRPAVDDHGIHSREIGAWLKSERSHGLPKILQVIAEQHKAYHDQLMIRQMQTVQSLQRGVQPTAGYLAPAPGSGPGDQNPMRTGSSPQRMEGDYNEMAADVASGSM